MVESLSNVREALSLNSSMEQIEHGGANLKSQHLKQKTNRQEGQGHLPLHQPALHLDPVSKKEDIIKE